MENPTTNQAPEGKLHFSKHLEELRRRFLICLASVAAGFLACYAFKEQIFAFITIPLVASLPPDNSALIFTGVTEAFFTYLKVAFLAGFFLSLPVVFYQLWAFISPGLYKKEKTVVVPFVIFSTLFFVTGSSFGYFVVFPFGFKFLMGFANETIHAYPTMSQTLSFVTKLLLAFGLVFELPLLSYFLARAGLLKHEMLARNRRYFVVIAFVVSALITPPDYFTQLLMAGPLIILFEVSVQVARIFGRKPLVDTSGNLVDED